MFAEMKSWLKRSRFLVGMVREGRRLRDLSHLPLRPFQVRAYLTSHQLRKLQIGSGATVLDGWLSTDYEPASSRVVYLDATQKFPFDENTFDYVYCEHMIEHVPYTAGLCMLKECHRVMRNGGVIRVATPDLEVLLNLMTKEPNETQRRYIDWICERYLTSVAYGPVHVINNAFRSWGHQFLYDENVLRTSIEEAGFRDVRRYAHSKSDDPNLRGLESHGRSVGNEEMNIFETMVFEGICSK